MKSVIALLVATVSAQDGESAYVCADNQHCADNFEAIYAEWEQNPDQPEGSEPQEGDLVCAAATVSGCDEESGECGSAELNICVPSAACSGFEYAADDDSGQGFSVAEGACMSAVKVVAGLASAAIAVAATL